MAIKFRVYGFTMIELLVVIAVIGILAVALLATLNPLEQIRKGRDTRTRSDVSQLTSALERYNASIGRFPWQATEGELIDLDWVQVNGGATETVTGCTATGEAGDCTIGAVLDEITATNEVKSSFVDRITAASSRNIYVFYDSTNSSSSVIACFTPESNTFAREAFDRCATGTFGSEFTYSFVDAGAGLQDDTAACPDGASAASYAGTFDADDADEMICLP